MRWTETQIRNFWRKKYPWFFVMYIILFGILRGVLSTADAQFAMDILMISAFVSYIFLYVFYLYGVRPDEMEDWHSKYKKIKKARK